MLNKQSILRKNKLNTSNVTKDNTNPDKTYSQEIYDAQVILKNLGLYLSTVDGINGPGTKRAVREFQSKAGLVTDGVIGSKTKAALNRGEESYINNTEPSQPSNNSPQSSNETTTYGLDLRNYDPSKPCIEGYVDSNSIWVPDPVLNRFLFIDLVKQLK